MCIYESQHTLTIQGWISSCLLVFVWQPGDALQLYIYDWVRVDLPTFDSELTKKPLTAVFQVLFVPSLPIKPPEQVSAAVFCRWEEFVRWPTRLVFELDFMSFHEDISPKKAKIRSTWINCDNLAVSLHCIPTRELIVRSFYSDFPGLTILGSCHVASQLCFALDLGKFKPSVVNSLNVDCTCCSCDSHQGESWLDFHLWVVFLLINDDLKSAYISINNAIRKVGKFN